jgi:hypothetical protein
MLCFHCMSESRPTEHSEITGVRYISGHCLLLFLFQVIIHTATTHCACWGHNHHSLCTALAKRSVAPRVLPSADILMLHNRSTCF